MSPFESKNLVSTFEQMELLHLDLFAPRKVASLCGQYYGLVIVDDCSRFTWVIFLTFKNGSFEKFSIFCKRVQNEKGFHIFAIRIGNGGESKNVKFKSFCEESGIPRKLLAPRTPWSSRAEKIGLSKRWLELCCMGNLCKSISRREVSALHATSIIECC